MELVAGMFGTVCIIAGIVFAFGGALGNSMPTVIFAGVLAGGGITAIFLAAGWAIVYALAGGVVLPIAAWVLFWKWSFRKKKQVR